MLLERVHEFPEGKLIAGGTELGLAITKLFQVFPVLISIEAVSELRRIDCNETQWRIGGAATLTDVWDRLGEEFPPLAEMLRLFGSRQIRNRATRGGNLVTASPIGESAAVLRSLDAVMVIASLAGERQVPADEFFVSYRKTVLQADEILKEIILPRIDPGPMLGGRAADPTSPEADTDSGGRFQGFVGQAPIPPRKGSPSSVESKSWCQFYKISRRREMEISTVASCFRIELNSDRRIKLARLPYGPVAPTPLPPTPPQATLLSKI